MVFVEQEVSCAGCGRVHKCFFPGERFAYQLRHYGQANQVTEFNFCNLSCLLRWIEKRTPQIVLEGRDKELRQICKQREADYEGVICWECKQKQDKLDFEEDREGFEADMLSYNHQGEWCWVNDRIFCLEGQCSGCQIYLDWRERRDED